MNVREMRKNPSPNMLDVTAPRIDFVPKEHYVSSEINHLANTRLWQRVWQVACREEEIPDPGNFVRYNVVDQSVVVLRGNDGKIRAFHNACQHRGNELISQERGQIARFYCSFHGWQWNLDGSNIFIKDHEDWSGYSSISDQDVRLKEVRAEMWGGFVFINMDPSAESLMEFLDPLPEYLNCIELEKMRFKRYATVRLKANWLTALTAFPESYHVYTTHPQLKMTVDDISVSYVHGRHGSHCYPNTRPIGAPSSRTGLPVPSDLREGFIRAMDGRSTPANRNGVVSERSSRAVLRLLDEVPPNASPEEIYRSANQFMREAAEAEGAGWPEVTAEQMARLDIEWNIFPNMATAVSLDAALFFRARPDSTEVASCLFDVWMLERVAPDKAPTYEREFYPEWQPGEKALPELVTQDLRNIEGVQRGMNSIGFSGSRTNPIQERQISNLHRVLDEYLFGPRS
jgi:phenylpropionate dioxygenase-like ring-hydroxylating dioxygenase large terminal subunit